METIDWAVLSITLIFVVVYGIWKTRSNKGIKDYVLGGKKARWHTIGLSVMATQASAITFLSTPGQAFHDGMGFVQFYFGLPLAMVLICLVFIPIYHRLQVFTAYELLEQKFNLKTRTLTAALFLIQRGLAAGITIYAPSIILSAILGWDLEILNIIIGIIVIIYTVSGGTKAVNVTQKQQMFIIIGGMATAFYLILQYLPEDITFSKALKIAGASEKLNILDFSLNMENRYTFWAGITGGLFLQLSYFGTDQSQVQRYLTGKSIRESQLGLIFNGLLKVPMQFFILLTGIMVFVFYQFNTSPLHFNPSATKTVLESSESESYKKLQQQHQELSIEKKTTQQEFSNALDAKEYGAIEAIREKMTTLNQQELELRHQAKALIKKANKYEEVNDKDYVFIHFVLHHLPRGLIGLLLAVILSAAMSSTASELNALGVITSIDLYKRNRTKITAESHFVKSAKWFTLLWGIIAIVIACIANLFDNLIQLVNIIGSIFYGNVLGIFLLAFFASKLVKGNAVFVAAIITQIIIILDYSLEWVSVSYLWLNVFGCVLVILLAFTIQKLINIFQKKSKE